MKVKVNVRVERRWRRDANGCFVAQFTVDSENADSDGRAFLGDYGVSTVVLSNLGGVGEHFYLNWFLRDLLEVRIGYPTIKVWVGEGGRRLLRRGDPEEDSKGPAVDFLQLLPDKDR